MDLGSAPRLGRLYPREGPCTHCTGGWVGPRAGLEEQKISSPTGIRSRTFQPVVSRYTDWAIGPHLIVSFPLFTFSDVLVNWSVMVEYSSAEVSVLLSVRFTFQSYALVLLQMMVLRLLRSLETVFWTSVPYAGSTAVGTNAQAATCWANTVQLDTSSTSGVSILMSFIFGRASNLYLCLYNQLFALFTLCF